jgi:hypothetical protein
MLSFLEVAGKESSHCEAAFVERYGSTGTFQALNSQEVVELGTNASAECVGKCLG